jgi:Transcription factor WhiB
MTAEWQDQAACRGVGDDTFFDYKRVAEAQRICGTCPVTEQCAAHGATAYRGVWGGQVVRATSTGPSTTGPWIEEHGTDVGYQRHMHRGERPCDRCTVAHTFAKRERAKATA